jgi:multicomponent Na+:H+ antiporter subunit D
VVVASTLLSLAYAGRLVERIYLGSSPETAGRPAATDGGSDWTAGDRGGPAVLAAAAVLVVALGLGSSALAEWVAPVVEGWL